MLIYADNMNRSGQINEPTNERADEQMNRQTNERTGGRRETCSSPPRGWVGERDKG